MGLEYCESADGTIISGINVEVPDHLVKYPNQNLANKLRQTGITRAQANARMGILNLQAVVKTPVNADLIVAPMHGRSLYERIFPGEEKEKPEAAEMIVRTAILETVGSGRNHYIRHLFDALVLDGRRVAVISGLGSKQGEIWLMDDSGRQPFRPMSDVVRWVEDRGIYGAIVAHLSNPMGRAPLTRSLPFFYVTGSFDNTDGRKKVRSQYYMPKSR